MCYLYTNKFVCTLNIFSLQERVYSSICRAGVGVAFEQLDASAVCNIENT